MHAGAGLTLMRQSEPSAMWFRNATRMGCGGMGIRVKGGWWLTHSLPQLGNDFPAGGVLCLHTTTASRATLESLTSISIESSYQLSQISNLHSQAAANMRKCLCALADYLSDTLQLQPAGSYV